MRLLLEAEPPWRALLQQLPSCVPSSYSPPSLLLLLLLLRLPLPWAAPASSCAARGSCSSSSSCCCCCCCCHRRRGCHPSAGALRVSESISPVRLRARTPALPACCWGEGDEGKGKSNFAVAMHAVWIARGGVRPLRAPPVVRRATDIARSVAVFSGRSASVPRPRFICSDHDVRKDSGAILSSLSSWLCPGAARTASDQRDCTKKKIFCQHTLWGSLCVGVWCEWHDAGLSLSSALSRLLARKPTSNGRRGPERCPSTHRRSAAFFFQSTACALLCLWVGKKARLDSRTASPVRIFALPSPSEAKQAASNQRACPSTTTTTTTPSHPSSSVRRIDRPVEIKVRESWRSGGKPLGRRPSM